MADDNVTPLRPGVVVRGRDQMVEFFAQKLATFAETHGVEPDAVVITMWGNEPKENDFCFMAGCMSTGNTGLSRHQYYGTAASILLGGNRQ